MNAAPSPLATDPDSLRHEARIAGLLYGLASSLAPFAYLHVPGRLIVGDDALATLERVRGSEFLLRAAIGCELYGAVLLLFAALALYRLFERVDVPVARVMAAMMLVSVPISFVNALLHVAPLVLVKTTAITAALDPDALAGLVLFFLRLHNSGLLVNQVFWGLWLVPIGVLVMRSGFLPRWLAYPLFAAGYGYVFHSLGALLLPPSWRWLTGNLQVLGVGEMPLFSFYLLIWGVRGRPADPVVTGLALALFATALLGLLSLKLAWLDVHGYAAVKTFGLALVLGLVLRWRALRRPAVAA